jgi:hypothetical protein
VATIIISPVATIAPPRLRFEERPPVCVSIRIECQNPQLDCNRINVRQHRRQQTMKPPSAIRTEAIGITGQHAHRIAAVSAEDQPHRAKPFHTRNRLPSAIELLTRCG